jgi:hypothetical protein
MYEIGFTTYCSMADQHARTVRPPFDPQEFARQSELPTTRPPARRAASDPDVTTEVHERIASVQGG